jgi:S-ribosylhomocysteine lyase
MNTAEIHAMEHLGATYLRNHEVYDSLTLYFGPMGCRTGFYLLLTGDYESKDILSLMRYVRERVKENSGVTLEEEIRLLGADGEFYRL